MMTFPLLIIPWPSLILIWMLISTPGLALIVILDGVLIMRRMLRRILIFIRELTLRMSRQRLLILMPWGLLVLDNNNNIEKLIVQNTSRWLIRFLFVEHHYIGFTFSLIWETSRGFIWSSLTSWGILDLLILQPILFSMCLCIRFQSDPREIYLTTVKRIFRYLKGMTNLGLLYKKYVDYKLTELYDVDYARG